MYYLYAQGHSVECVDYLCQRETHSWSTCYLWWHWRHLEKTSSVSRLNKIETHWSS